MEINKILNDIVAYIKELHEEHINLIEKRHEEEIIIEQSTIHDKQHLAAALAKTQEEMKVAGKDKINPFFKSKYADWESVIAASRPALTKHGLSVTFDFRSYEENVFLVCTVLHSSGQSKESVMRFSPPKTDIQSIASYNTSLKRLMYANAIGLCVGDEDDDGEAAVSSVRQSSVQTISKDQLHEIEYELSGHPALAEKVLKALNIQTFSEMPSSRYRYSIDRIREMKKTESKG